MTDGAVEIGRISRCEHQECFAHEIHLSVSDVLCKTKPSMRTHELSEKCHDGST